MTNDDENKPQKKIQVFNNKDGTYNRKDFVDDKLVNEEFIDRRLVKPNDEGLKFYNSRHDDHQPPAGKIKQKKPQKIQDVPKASDSNILDMIKNKAEHNADEENPLRKFLNSVRVEAEWPKTYKESDLYQAGFRDGYSEGFEDAQADTRRVIQSIDNIISLWKDTES